LKKEKNTNEKMKLFFTNILDNIPVAICVRDFTDNKFIYWNKRMEDMTLIKSKDAIGKRIRNYSLPKYIENIRKLIRD